METRTKANVSRISAFLSRSASQTHQSLYEKHANGVFAERMMRDRASSHSNFVFQYSNAVCVRKSGKEKAFGNYTTEQYLNEAKVSFELFFLAYVVSK